jgi:dienelactone hydrolase
MSSVRRCDGSLLGRRQLLAGSAAALGTSLWPLGVPCSLIAAEPSKKTFEPLNHYPHMVQEYFVDQLRDVERRATQRKQALKTKADAEAYVKDVRGRIAESFGPKPERTPLNAKITGVVERDEYNIEKVIFESRPGMLVTANLYIPKARKFPLPAVVGTCGHSSNGKAAAPYQSFAQGLARLGYVVLIYDPIGQGERLQYVDDRLKPLHGIGVSEHLYAGNQQFLVGEFLGAWRAWDGIRALDYLLERDEVDPQHVGVTGNSGGGTMTTWLCGVEDRWTMAAPSCFVTTFRRNLENELPADTEQCPPRVLGLGLDHDDFLAAMAPKPVIILGKERDFFDVRGVHAAYHRLKHLYTLLGKPDNIGMFVGPTEHGYSQENREAMYRWFHRAIGAGDVSAEPDLKMEQDETLQCTPHGQVAELRSRTVFSFTQDKAMELAKERKPLTGDALQSKVSQVLRLPKREGPPEFRILRPLANRGYPRPAASQYAIESEPGVLVLVSMLGRTRYVSRPPRGNGPAVLYVSDRSADAELRDEPLVRELADSDEDTPLFACDVRGIGESRPDTCGYDQYEKPYGSDYFYAIHSIMLDRPYVGQRTHDVLAVLDWLADHGYTEVHLVGRGWGTLPAALAALVSPHVARVTLKNALTSYEAVATSESYDWPLSSFVPGVLADFDLPEVYRALEKKQLKQIEPCGPSGRPVSAE